LATAGEAPKVTGPGAADDAVASDRDTNLLSARERQVAEHIANGLNNAEIAKLLSLSRPTVASHVAKILKKLKLRSRVQIAVWVTQRQLDDGERRP
jgi:two-component system, NarL family, nitrate/nitrite response regulator NarL